MLILEILRDDLEELPLPVVLPLVRLELHNQLPVLVLDVEDIVNLP